MPLTITIPGEEWLDPDGIRFHYGSDEKLVLEHSLISISKWEAIWKKPYLDDKRNKTNDELYSYIQCMTIKGNCSDEVLSRITASEYKRIIDYIDDPMSATITQHLKKPAPGSSSPMITSELIYSWMVEYRIPPDYEKWHLNRLMKLIDVISINHQDPKKNKMSHSEMVARRNQINAANKAKFASKK